MEFKKSKFDGLLCCYEAGENFKMTFKRIETGLILCKLYLKIDNDFICVKSETVNIQKKVGKDNKEYEFFLFGEILFSLTFKENRVFCFRNVNNKVIDKENKNKF